MKNALLFSLLLTLSACAYVDPSLTDQTKVYYDSPVRKSTVQVSVHPKNKQHRPLTAYFHPFVIQQENSDYAHLSTAFAQIFHNVWTAERIFPIQEFQPGTPYQGVNEALNTARRRGADLLILGFVPYFYAGHTIDDTAITIQINIYAAGTGDLLWTMMQSGRIEDKFPDDYFYFRHEYRLNEGPFNKIIRSIASDMAIPLKAWLPSPDTQYQFASTPSEIQQNLVQPQPLGEAEVDQDLPTEPMSDPAYGSEKKDGEEAERPKVNGVNLQVEFDFDKSTINPKSYPLLDAFGEAMNSPELKGRRISIAGHTDSQGTVAYNLQLSQKRAQAVKDYLVNKWGVRPEQVEIVGYGKSIPLTEGKTAEDMKKNRRVEVRLID